MLTVKIGNGSGSKSKSKKNMTHEEQSAQFIKTARELECDESGEVFKRVSEQILKPKPE